MSVSPQRRAEIAATLLQFGPARLTRNSTFRQGLDEYVETGRVTDTGTAIAGRLKQMVADLELEDLDTGDEDAVREKAVTLLKRYFSRAVPDENTRNMMTDIISDPDLPIFGDDAAKQAYMAREVPQLMNQIMDHQAKSLPPDQRMRMSQNVNASMAAMMATGGFGNVDFNDEKWQRRYVTALVDQQFPHFTPQERERAIAEYITVMPILWESERGLRLPEGCYIPLAFLALFVGLNAVMGLLLLLLLGQTYLMFGASNTDVGQALNATLLVMSVIGSVWFWLRGQAGSTAGIIRLALIALFVGGIAFVTVQALSIDADTVTQGFEDDTEGTVNAALLALSIGTSVILWLRRRAINLLWLVLLALLVVALVLLADQSGAIDLGVLDFTVEQGSGGEGFQ